MKGGDMQIRWRNVIALALVVFAGVVGMKTYPQIAAFVSSIKAVGPGHDSEDRTVGLIAFGVVAITVVVLIRVLRDRD